MKSLTRHILRLLLVLLPLCLNAQENYVRTWQYLDPSGSDSRARVSTAYFDGLGRERQQVLHGAGGDGNNIVSRTDYDARGNVGRKWLPVSSGSAFLSDRAFKKASADMYGAEEIAFSSFSYEHSGMNRPVREDGPGLDWNGHGTSVSRHRNETSGLLSCLMLRSDGDGSVSACGVYRPGTLAVTVSTNPDGLQEFEFRNLADRVVLRRMVTAEGDSVADTRFIYDARGDLRCALSPEGSCLLPEDGSVDDSVLDDFGQRFSYDLWHRCVSAKAPGCGEVHYVYNRFGDVCLESTAVQRESGTWTMTKFDRHRRPAVRGLVTVPGATRESLQRLYGDSLLQEAFVPGLDSLEPYLMYTNRCGPAEFVPYMAWYYDSYDFICYGNESLRSALETPLAPGHTQKGLCTGTAMCPDASGDIWLTAVRYDHRGLPVNSCLWDVFQQERRLIVDNTYDFAGNLTERSEVMEVVSEAMVLERHSALTRFEYDDYGRETRSVLRVDSFPEVVLSESVYDALGRLSVESGAVMTEYSYDIRSNLTGIQSDFFSQNAWFGTSPVPDAPVSHTGINALQSSWFDGQDAAGVYSRTELFGYDGFGRYRSSVTDDGQISETVTTDLDANVTSVRRTYNGDVIQDAALMYEGGKNTEVYDESTPYWAESVGRFPPGAYEIRYDADGRIVSDGTRQIKKISYHPFLNLPDRISMENGEYTRNRYFPDGTLLGRTFAANSIKTTVKVDANGDTIRTEKLVYESRYSSYLGSFETGKSRNIYHTAQGYYDIDSGRHYWYQRDRLGSTVAVYDDRGRMLQNTAYYPSGTPCRLPNHAIGTEVDSATDRLHIGNIWLSHSGMNLYDNTARLHDPILMHYGAPDPLYHNYPYNSPWSHCSGDPLNRIDPTGMTDFYNEELRQVMYRNDGHHQVLQITKSQYEALLAVNFDINTPEYQDALDRGKKRPDLNFTVENTLKGRKFVGYDHTDPEGCFRRAEKQNNIATTGPTWKIDTYNTDEEAFNLQEGIEYMRGQLADGYSVIAGVNYNNKKTDNKNHNTAHFLNIVGMGFEIVNGKPRNYFSYYDNGTSTVSDGTNLINNRFYIETDDRLKVRVLYDETNLNVLNAKFFKVTEIRRNIKPKKKK